jgi:hypothetical protein
MGDRVAVDVFPVFGDFLDRHRQSGRGHDGRTDRPSNDRALA